MSQQSARNVARRLFAGEEPEAPEGLAERVKSTIPEPGILASMATTAPPPGRPWLATLLPVAASVVLVLGAGLLALGLAGRSTPPDEPGRVAQTVPDTGEREPTAGKVLPAASEPEPVARGGRGPVDPEGGEEPVPSGSTAPAELSPSEVTAANLGPAATRKRCGPRKTPYDGPVQDPTDARRKCRPRTTWAASGGSAQTPQPVNQGRGVSVVEQTRPRPTPPRLARATPPPRIVQTPPPGLRRPSRTTRERGSSVSPTTAQPYPETGVAPVIPVPVLVPPVATPTLPQYVDPWGRNRHGGTTTTYGPAPTPADPYGRNRQRGPHSPGADWVEEARSAAPPPLVSRDEIPLRVDLDSAVALDYAEGYLWVATEVGELWRFDQRGNGDLITPELELSHGMGLWSRGETAVLLVGERMYQATVEEGVRRLSRVEPDRTQAVPVERGVVSLVSLSHEDPAGTYIVHRHVHGKRWLLALFVKRDSRWLRSRDDSVFPVSPSADLERLKLLRVRWNREEPGLLAALDDERVAWVTDDPYRVWLVGVDGSIEQLEVDESAVVSPERASHPQTEGQEWLRVERRQSRRACSHEGQLVIERSYVRAASRGSRPTLSFTMIDFIDLSSGQVTHRVNLSHLERRGSWAGVEGTALVFMDPYDGQAVMRLVDR